MSREEIIEGNTRIMQFDGWKFTAKQTFDPEHNVQNPGSNTYHVYEKDGLTVRLEDIEFDIVYHQSWNALMPIVEKIEDLGVKVEIEGKGCDINRINPFHRYHNGAACDTKIESVWVAVVDFIKWYKNEPGGKRNETVMPIKEQKSGQQTLKTKEHE